MMKINLESSEVLDCALGAIGADALFAFSFSTASVWSATAITKAFSAVAKKFLLFYVFLTNHLINYAKLLYPFFYSLNSF